jgi:two-component system, response regulator PdtaR
VTGRPPRTFLVVDDDVVALEVARERLERAGFTVVTRTSALGTSAFIMKEKPDFVLLDVNMPGLTGDALAKLLKGRRHTRVILHSGSDRKRLATLATECGAVGIIEKTDSERQFLAQLEKFVGPLGD